MPDREKVIKGLEICEKKDCVLCPYKDEKDETYSGFCEQVLKQDALVLLKEQDAKRPNMMQDVEGIWSTCPTCGHKLRAILANTMDLSFPKFCSECGQAVKWE